MKKFVSILIVVAMVMVGMLAATTPASVAADTEVIQEECFTLLAGQDINVGKVCVWHDTDNLYVKYETTGGWKMTETHLAVATDLDDIPQKNGNPIPGQFLPYSTKHDPAVTEWTYEIPLGLGSEPLVIAAHAKVQLPELLSAPITASVASGDALGDVLLDNVLHIAEDTLNPGYPIDYSGPYAGTPSPAVLTWKHPSWPTITGAQWISSAYYTEAPVSNNSWRLFTRNIVIPLNAVNITGTLTSMTADNAEEVYLNGTLIGSDGEVYGPYGDNHEWGTIDEFPDLNLSLWTNTLEVMVRNYPGSSSSTANPTGLIYKLDYQYQIVERELQTETAWGAGEDFEGKNWATYFSYTVQPILVDTVQVTPYGTDKYIPIPTYSNIDLEEGKNYSLKASGTYRFANWGEYGIADAAWNYRNAAHAPGGIAGWYQQASQRLQVWIGGAAVTWQPTLFNPDHIYTFDVNGDGNQLMFTIVDDAYSDNSGFITVEIYWTP